MHLPTNFGLLGLLMAVLLHVAVTFPVDDSALAQHESYLAADEVFGPELKERTDREKRKGTFLEPVVEATFGAKSRLIGLLFGKINQLIDSKYHYVDQLDRKNIELNKRVLANLKCNTATGGTYFGSSSTSGSTANAGSSGSVYNIPAAPQSGSTNYVDQSGQTFTSSAGQNAINYNPSVGQAAVSYSPTAGQTESSFGTSFSVSAGQTGPGLEYLPSPTGPSYDSSGPSYQQNVPSTGNDYGYNY